jgi:glyoxylase-like metal-dependent hydrolase (beta-lactamase superfamily II)
MLGTQVFSVTDNVWCVRRPSYLTCSYLVRTPRGIVLVDAGMDSTGADVHRGLERMGAASSSITSVLLTHWHNDHAAGARAIQEESNVPAFCHRQEVPQLTRETARGGLLGRVSDLIPEWGVFVLFKGLLGEATPRAVLKPQTVEDGNIIEQYFEVVETPGHTPGHLSFYYKPEKILFAGDALAVVENHVHFMARAVTPDVENARKSMRRCLTLDIDVLCPGHRIPLKENVRRKCDQMLDHIDKGGRWPLFG